MCMSVSEDCINIHSYGVICVHCGCCKKYNPNEIDRTERQIEYYKGRLEDNLHFDRFSDDEEIADFQRRNIAKNIEYYKKKIAELKSML